MNRYIDAEKLKAENRKHFPLLSLRCELNHIINEQPTADVRENVHGEWIREVLGSTSGYGTTVMYQCSECERMSVNKYKFCPNCGADMRGGSE